ncbi:MAG: LuxR C-terminal-related transcriptional regulator [Solirubrobacteraceae bacterium MAG38_C4-C5]|nr:LuxR C-terminal-related transcriptional regulator [Candidatus Siliceabacter maunaloa]
MGVRGALLVEGPPGIGKTALLEWCVAHATSIGVRVLYAAATPSTAERPLAVARALLGDEVVHEAVAAHPVSTLSSPEAAAQGSESAVRALAERFGSVAEERPTLIVVDDGHHADRSSLLALAQAARGASVNLVVAGWPVRPAEHDEGYVQLALHIGAQHLVVGPLDAPDVDSMLRAQKLPTELAPPCLHATGGNPFLLNALLEDLTRTATAADLARLAPSLVRRRVADAVGDGERRGVAAALAALDQPTDAGLLGEVADMAVPQASRVIDALVTAHVISRERPLRFAHPILREAVYAELPLGERSAVHERAARALTRRGAGLDEVAAHLLHVTPGGNDEHVETLVAAAQRASVLADPAAAARFLERALAEPPPPSHARRLLASYGEALLLTGEAVGAARALRSALEQTTDPAERSARTRTLARALTRDDDVPGAVNALQAEADRLGAHERGHAVALEMELLTLAPTDAALFAMVHRRFDRLRPELDAEDPAQLSLILAGDELVVMSRGSAEEAAQLAERALRQTDDVRAAGHALVHIRAAWMLLRAERFEEADGELQRMRAVARLSGSVSDEAFVEAFLAYLHLYTGPMSAAVSHGLRACELGAQARWSLPQQYGASFAARAFLHAGKLEDALGTLATAPVSPANGRSMGSTMMSLATGLCRLAEGRLREALDELLAVREDKRRAGAPNPAGWPWLEPAVVAFLRLDREDEARRLARAELEPAQRWGSPALVATALRAIARTVDDALERLEMLEEGWRLAGRSPAALERALAANALATELGRADRRHTKLTREAQEAIQTAGLAPTMEPLGWIRRDTASALGALTAREREVSVLVSEGLTNDQIARRLSVSPRTIQAHVASALRKAGVGRRTQLARLVLQEGLAQES